MLLTAGLETNYGMPAQSMRSSASSPPLPDVSPIQISNSGRLLCQLPERLQDKMLAFEKGQHAWSKFLRSV